MASENEILETKTLPMIAMRGIVLFPNMILHFDVGRKKSIAPPKGLLCLSVFGCGCNFKRNMLFKRVALNPRCATSVYAVLADYDCFDGFV